MQEDVPITVREIETLGVTRREAEILYWVCQGKTNAEIGVLCDISERTVQKHLEHVYQKLGIESRIAVMQRTLGLRKTSGRFS